MFLFNNIFKVGGNAIPTGETNSPLTNFEKSSK